MTKIDIKELSIQVSLSGLSFCILNRTSSSIEMLYSKIFEQKLSPSGMLSALISELSSNTIFASTTFNSVVVVHQNELATLVPSALYEESKNADYLKFNNKILKTDFISTDNVAANASINVYVPYVNINNYLFDTFGPFLYKHASTVLIDALLTEFKSVNKTNLIVNVTGLTLDIVLIRNGILELHNSFEYHSKEDFIYYILFIYEQMNLDPEHDALKLTGHIKQNDDLYEILYKYIRHIEFKPPTQTYKINPHIENDSLYEHYVILNSF